MTRFYFSIKGVAHQSLTKCPRSLPPSASRLARAVVETNGDVARFHVLAADDKHRVYAKSFGVGTRGFERCDAEVQIHADLIGAEFVDDALYSSEFEFGEDFAAREPHDHGMETNGS